MQNPNLMDIVVQYCPLFSPALQKRTTSLQGFEPFYPNHIKFIHNPDDTQQLFTGMFFQIPSLDPFAMHELHDATIKALLRGSKATSVPLTVKDSTLEALKNHQSKNSSLFNSFEVRGKNAYLKTANCVLVDSRQSRIPTSIHDPQYGQVVDLPTAGFFLSLLLSTYAIEPSLSHAEKEKVMQTNIRLLEKRYGSMGPKFSFNGSPVIDFCGVRIDEFHSREGESEIYGYLQALMDYYTDLSQHFYW